MSVGDSFAFATRPFDQLGDLGMPAGYWAVYGEVVSDETGGTRTLTHLFQVLPGISNSNFYSIEQVDAHDLAGEGEFVIETTGMDAIFPEFQGAASNAHFWRINLTDVSLTGPQIFAMNLTNSVDVRGLFLGQPSRNPSLSALLIATIDNPAGNNFNFNCKIQGYFWAPGAMNTPGGLKRPPNGLFSY